MAARQQRLYFSPLAHGQSSFGSIFTTPCRTTMPCLLVRSLLLYRMTLSIGARAFSKPLRPRSLGPRTAPDDPVQEEKAREIVLNVIDADLEIGQATVKTTECASGIRQVERGLWTELGLELKVDPHLHSL